MLIQCASCQREIANDADNRRPPWCPHCGGDLKVVNTAPAPVLAAAGPAAPPSAPGHGIDTTAAPALAEPWEQARPPLAEPREQVLRLEDLGTPDEVYTGSTRRQMVCWLCCLLCFGFAGLIGYSVLVQPHKSPTAGLALLAMAALGGFAFLYYALTMGELSYQVFPDALVEKRGKESKIIPWEMIREVYQTIQPVWKKYRIVTRKGFDIMLTGDIKNYRALGEHVQEKVAEILLPAALADLEQGRAVRFGPLSVSRAALHFDGDTSGWQQVSMNVGLDAEPVRGNVYSNLMHLHVYSQVRTKAFKVEIGKIPNYRLFVELVRQTGGPQCAPPEI